MVFHKFDYTTPASIQARNLILEKSDLIFYVCGTSAEVEKLTNSSFKFGSNSFHHDYNKIHFLNSFENKCFNITFNDCVKPYLNTSQEVGREQDQLHVSKESDSSTKTLCLFNRTTFNESCSKDLRCVRIDRSSCVKLPHHNDKLISLIRQKVHYDLSDKENYKRHDLRKRSKLHSNKFVVYLSDIYSDFCCKRLRSTLDKEANRFVLKKLFVLTVFI
jgi:hypothetical protein